MSTDQVLSSETPAPSEKPRDHEEISGNQKITKSQIVVIANGLQVKSNLNPNALEFYPTWILPKVDKGEGKANAIVKEKFPIETLEDIKRPCHYEITQEIFNNDDRLVEIIERPEKGLKMVANVEVEEIIERKFSEDFEKSFLNQSKENEKDETEKCKEPQKVMESIKCDMTTTCEKSVSCKANKEGLNSNVETTLNSKEILVKCKDEESIRKHLQQEVSSDPQVLFFGPVTVKNSESDVGLKQNKTSNIERSKKIESVDQVITGQCSDNAIIENTVVGDHTEANMDLQINKVSESQTKKNPKILDGIAPTSTTKLKGKIPSSRIALPGTLKAVSRTLAGNIKSTGTVKKLMSTTKSTTKETKVVFSASAATRNCSITPRKLQSTLEEKKNETLKNITPSSNLSILSTNTKKTSFQSRSSLISSNNSIKADVLPKSKTKDSISLRSTCSTDKNSLPNKSSSLSSTAKVPSSKVVEKSISKSSTRPIDRTSVKRTDHLTRTHGGTVSSNLRKTETQKRQNLFPDSDAIKMTEILFK